MNLVNTTEREQNTDINKLFWPIQHGLALHMLNCFTCSGWLWSWARDRRASYVVANLPWQ